MCASDLGPMNRLRIKLVITLLIAFGVVIQNLGQVRMESNGRRLENCKDFAESPDGLRIATGGRIRPMQVSGTALAAGSSHKNSTHNTGG